MIESLGVLPIYDSIGKQKRNYPCEENNCEVCFQSTSSLIPNFIFRRPPSPNLITAFRIYKSDNTLFDTLYLPQIESQQLVTGGETWDYFWWDMQALKDNSNTIHTGILPDESYYFELVCADGNYYSEIFCVKETKILSDGVELLNNNSFNLGSAGWTILNADVTIASGSAFMNDSSESGPMFRLSTPFPIVADTLYKVCIDISNTVISGGNVTITTGDGIYFINAAGIYCFYSRNPGSLIVSSTGTVWNINSFSIQAATGTECLNMIRWWDNCDMDKIPYTTIGGFKNVMFLGDDQGAMVFRGPDYLSNQNQFENGQLDKFKSFQRTDKQYLLTLGLINEPEMDALQLMKVHSNILFNIPQNNYTFNKILNVDELTLSHVWDFSDKCGATVEVRIANALVIKSGCCSDFEDAECPECEESVTSIPFEFAECNEGFVTITSSTGLPGSMTIGSTIIMSGWVPTFFNGTHSVTAIAGNSFTLDLECAGSGDITTEVDGTILFEFVNCFQEISLSFDDQGNPVITGTAFGSFVELLTGINSGGDPCDEITFTTTGLIISKEEFEDVGFTYPVDDAENRCFKIRSFNPMITGCTFEDSFCVCQEEVG